MTDPWTLGVDIATILVPPVTVVAVYLTYRFQLRTLARQSESSLGELRRTHALHVRALEGVHRREAYVEVVNSLWRLWQTSDAISSLNETRKITVEKPGIPQSFSRDDLNRVHLDVVGARTLLGIPQRLETSRVATLAEPEWFKFSFDSLQETIALAVTEHRQAQNNAARATTAADLSGAPGAVMDLIRSDVQSFGTLPTGPAPTEAERAGQLAELNMAFRQDLQGLQSTPGSLRTNERPATQDVPHDRSGIAATNPEKASGGTPIEGAGVQTRHPGNASPTQGWSDFFVLLSVMLLLAIFVPWDILLAIYRPVYYQVLMQGTFLSALLLTFPLLMRAERSLIFRLGLKPDAAMLFDRDEAGMSRVANQASNTAALFAGISLATVAFVLSRSNPPLPSSAVDLAGVGLMLGSFVMLAWSMALFTSSAVPTREKTLSGIAFRQAEWMLGGGIFVFYGGLVWTLAAFNVVLYVVATIAYVIVYSANMLLPSGKRFTF